MLINTTKITKEEIKEFNNECPYGQGIFVEPYGIPVHIKEPVVYIRYETGGMRGGTCWGDDPVPYTETERPRFVALDLLLKKLKPNISYLDYRIIENMIEDCHDTQYEYYGNSTEYEVKYIVLSELEKFIQTLNY